MQAALPKADVGVIIGRFQVPELHKAHKELIDTVRKNHKKVLVLLGVSPVRITRNNPLDYMTRCAMLRKAYPDVVVLPLKDSASDEVWSKQVDQIVHDIVEEGTAVVYGSRDSFIPHYRGELRTVELAPRHVISGSEVRKMASEEVRTSRDFRAGVVYAAFNKYATSYQTVDAAIIKPNKQVLMASKKGDGAYWRFIGGFVRPEDESLEQAIQREAFEETSSLGVGAPEYIGSYRVSDWRYEGETDKILTAFFLLPYTHGYAKAADDIDEVSWRDCASLGSHNVVAEHLPLVAALKTKLFPKRKRIERCGEEGIEVF